MAKTILVLCKQTLLSYAVYRRVSEDPIHIRIAEMKKERRILFSASSAIRFIQVQVLFLFIVYIATLKILDDLVISGRFP